MTDLPTTMKVREDISNEVAKLSTEKQPSIAYLKAGETIELGPSSDLSVGDSCAIALSFAPAWEPWTDAISLAATPCLLQLGSKALPSSILRVGIRRELDGLVLSSSNTDDDGVLIKGDVREGGVLFIVFENQTATVTLGHVTSIIDGESVQFKLGSNKQPTIVTFGADTSANDEAPFVGLVGPLAIFDDAVDFADADKSELLLRLVKYADVRALAKLGAEDERPIATRLAAIALVDEKCLERNPREILWPDNDTPLRFVLEYSDTQPTQLTVPGKAREDHSLYTSTCLWCVVRSNGQLLLHGDAGQRFRLTYQGRQNFTGVSQGTNSFGTLDHTSTVTLEYSAEPAGVMSITPIDWTNRKKKLFPKATFPEKTSANIDDGLLWPETIKLTRVPNTYDLSRGTLEQQEQAQAFKDAFSKRLPLIGACSRGWDITKLDDPLNPINATGAQRDEEYYLFQQPADNSKYYRMETAIAAPYHCYTATLDAKQGSKMSRLYRSSAEYSESESESFGIDVGIGETKLFDMSFERSTTKDHKSGEEHSIVVSKASEIKDKVMLDKRWLHLTNKFRKAVSEAAASANRESHYALFEAFGTHYPNAITFGIRAYSLGLIDGETMGAMVERGIDIKGSVGIPVEAATIGLKGGYKSGSSKTMDAELKQEMELNVTVGSPDNPHPLMLDLRPITDLMQPPYITDPAVATALSSISRHLKDYIATKRKSQLAGYKIVQARLKSIMNSDPLYPMNLVGRAFLVGVDSNADWSIKLPEKSKRKLAKTRIWASTEKVDTAKFMQGGDGCYLSLKPMSIHTPDRTKWETANLVMPNSHPEIIPAIGWTANTTYFYEDKIHKRLDKVQVGWLSVYHTPASDKAMAKAEAKLSPGTGFEFFGITWADGLPEFYSAEFMSFTIQEKRKVSLKASSKWSPIIVPNDYLITIFEVRIVDPYDFFENADQYAVNQ